MSDDHHAPGGPRRRGPSALALIAAGAAVSLSLAAATFAAGRQVPTDPDQPMPPNVPSPPLPPPQPGPDEPPSMRPNPVRVERATGLRAVAFTRVAPVRGQARVRVYATLDGGPPCAVVGRIDVRETARVVTLTLWVGRRVGASCDGPQLPLEFPIVVSAGLSAPVGDRTVRDGSSRPC